MEYNVIVYRWILPLEMEKQYRGLWTKIVRSFGDIIARVYVTNFDNSPVGFKNRRVFDLIPGTVSG